jgi:hypothetical protein
VISAKYEMFIIFLIELSGALLAEREIWGLAVGKCGREAIKEVIWMTRWECRIEIKFSSSKQPNQL